MKITTVLLLVTLGLVCSAYAAPLTVQEQIYTLLRPEAAIVQDNDVKAQLFGTRRGRARWRARGIPLITKTGLRPTSIQDYDDSDAKAQFLLPPLPLLPLLLNNPFQEQAETERVMGKLIEATSKYGPEFLQRALKYGPKMLSNRDNGDDDDANAQIRPGLYSVSGDLITDLAYKLFRKIAKNTPRPSIQDDDDNNDNAWIETLLQSLQDKADIQTLGMLFGLSK